MKQKYVEKRFTNRVLGLIGTANTIIAAYEADGYSLTLRQLYYQFVSRDLIQNNMKEYKKLGSAINDARLAGLIDWNAIEDRTRNLQGNQHWENPGEIIDASAAGYALDKWEDQDYRVEVWVEKDALLGVMERVCRRLDVDYFSCRGYTSQSEMWRAGKRLSSYVKAGQKPIIIHLGDHDPSGKDMTRDVQDRLDMFCGEGEVQIHRIALNLDQVKKFNPPPNPAKLTDTRAKAYIREFGTKSWELDALDPKTLDALVTKNVKEFLDQKRYNTIKEKETKQKARLQEVADDFRE
jgi:hypothetical protein